MIDSHCHIGFEEGDLKGLLSRAEAVGVHRMLSVACEPKDYPVLVSLLKQYPQIDGAIGLHPEYAVSWDKIYPALNQIFQQNNRVVAVGECGLDYHYAPDTKKEQCHAFEAQIELAHTLQKPVIIHTRDAEEDTLSILESADRTGLLKYGAVLHCFTGSKRLADLALRMGLYLSASGVITFKSADELRAVFQDVPLDRLLIETDSPYLAPVPYRGKENEPAFVVKTAEKLAEIKSLPVLEIERITTQNYYQLFQISEVSDAN
ncbi:MAG: TatD family hydrolase [Alphaproteobacteria bacterium]|nr:TatD family hydrolase [Alphaproteobacteria bacterium]